MLLICPTCGQKIAAKQTNVERDLAMCESCDEAFTLSELVAGGQAEEELGDPPDGVIFHELPAGWEIAASTRNVVPGVTLLIFVSIWGGFSLGGIYGQQIIQGQFNLFLSLFGLPFLSGTIYMTSLVLMMFFGRVSIQVEHDDCRVFVGAFGIGRRKACLWNEVRRIEEALTRYRTNHQQHWIIVFQGPRKEIRFGALLPDPRREYLLKFLRRMLRHANDSHDSE